MTDQEFEEQRVRVTDKRRVDPETLEVRQQEEELMNGAPPAS